MKASTYFAFWLSLTAAVGVGYVSFWMSPIAAQGQTQAAPPDLRQALAQRTMELGTCNAQLGPLQQLSAQVLAGVVSSVDSFRQQVEKANPGKTLNEQLVIVDVKKE